MCATALVIGRSPHTFRPITLPLSSQASMKQLLSRLLLACAVASAISGICNDKKTDCSNWARDGECSGENAVRVIATLPERGSRRRHAQPD